MYVGMYALVSSKHRLQHDILIETSPSWLRTIDTSEPKRTKIETSRRPQADAGNPRICEGKPRLCKPFAMCFMQVLASECALLGCVIIDFHNNIVDRDMPSATVPAPSNF